MSNLETKPNRTTSYSGENIDKTEDTTTTTSNGDHGGAALSVTVTNTTNVNSGSDGIDLLHATDDHISGDSQQDEGQDKSSAKKSRGRPPKNKTPSSDQPLIQKNSLINEDANIDKMLNEMAKAEFEEECKRRNKDGRLINNEDRKAEEESILCILYLIAQLMGSYDMAEVLIKLSANYQIGQFGDKTILNKLRTRVNKSGDKKLIKFLIRKTQRERDAENLAKKVKQRGKHHAPNVADEED